jgi:hypothetical protein
MNRQATRRLVDATAELGAADRALMNLWVNLGLDDEHLAQMTGIRPETLHARRERIVDRLGHAMGLPGPSVEDALAELASGSREHLSRSDAPTGRVNGNGVSPPAVAGLLLGPSAARASSVQDPVGPAGLLLGPAAGRTRAAAEAAGPTGLMLGPAAAHPREQVPVRRRRRRMLWMSMALLVIVLAVVAAVVAGGGPSHRASAQTPGPSTLTSGPIGAATAPPPAPAASTPTTAAPGASAPAPATATAPAPSSAPSAPPAAEPTTTIALGVLPGGLMHVHGSVRLVGAAQHLRLELRVRGLPRVHRGHYEVWLYDSVLDSAPLGRLTARASRALYRLPRGAIHYRWVDISFQPSGDVNHSGESVLRATNPARTSARSVHQLKRRL